MAHSPKKAHLTPAFCETCGFDEYFQRHRIKPGRVGGKYRVGNVIALCPNHHAFADDGRLSIRELFEIVRKRLLAWLSDGMMTEEVYGNSISYIDKCVEELADRNTFDE